MAFVKKPSNLCGSAFVSAVSAMSWPVLAGFAITMPVYGYLNGTNWTF